MVVISILRAFCTPVVTLIFLSRPSQDLKIWTSSKHLVDLQKGFVYDEEEDFIGCQFVNI